MKKKDKKSSAPLCPVLKAMQIIKGRWTFPIIHTLLNGTRRFKELEREVAGINTRMLVKELKELELQGILKRKAYATIPPTVEYSLTPKGLALRKVIEEIGAWAEVHS